MASLNRIFKGMVQEDGPGNFSNLMLERLKNIETHLESITNNDGKPTQELSACLSEVKALRQQLNVALQVCHLTIDKDASLDDLVDLAHVFGFEVNVKFKPLTVAADQKSTTPTGPAPKRLSESILEGPFTVQTNKDDTVTTFELGDWVRYKDRTPFTWTKFNHGIGNSRAVERAIIICLDPVILTDSEMNSSWQGSFDLKELEVITGELLGHEFLVKSQQLFLSDEQRGSAVTRLEIKNNPST